MQRNNDNDLIQFLVFIGIALITSLVNWMRRRRDPLKEDSWPTTEEPPIEEPPPVRRPGQPSRPLAETDWEEELRRFLQGENAPQEKPAAPPPRPEPPPVPPALPPRPVPAPQPTMRRPAPPAPVPELVYGGEEERDRPSWRAPAPAVVSPMEKVAQHELEIIERLRAAGQQVKTHQPPAQVAKRGGGGEAVRARYLLRDRETLRAAMVASIILGPPKSLES